MPTGPPRPFRSSRMTRERFANAPAKAQRLLLVHKGRLGQLVVCLQEPHDLAEVIPRILWNPLELEWRGAALKDVFEPIGDGESVVRRLERVHQWANDRRVGAWL